MCREALRNPVRPAPIRLDQNVIRADTALLATVVLTPEAARDIADLPSPIVARMGMLVARLEQWPNVSGVKRLKGDLAGKCRLRTGDYRLQFRVGRTRTTVEVKKSVKGKTVVEEREVVETRVIVEKAGHRDGFHDE